MGTFFVLPVYLQVVLGFDAFETGKRPLPDVDLDAGRCAHRAEGARAVRAAAVVQVGLGAMAIAALVLVGTIDVTLNGRPSPCRSSSSGSAPGSSCRSSAT
jgi:hypothetical protein